MIPLAFTSSVDVCDLEPISADELGLENVVGNPNMMAHELRSTTGDAGNVWAAVVTVEPCSFSYVFAGDETVHVLEGRATVELPGADSIELSAGVVASFLKGTRSRWTVHSRLREFAVLTDS